MESCRESDGKLREQELFSQRMIISESSGPFLTGNETTWLASSPWHGIVFRLKQRNEISKRKDRLLSMSTPQFIVSSNKVYAFAGPHDSQLPTYGTTLSMRADFGQPRRSTDA